MLGSCASCWIHLLGFGRVCNSRKARPWEQEGASAHREQGMGGLILWVLAADSGLPEGFAPQEKGCGPALWGLQLSVCTWHAWFAGAAASIAPWTCTQCHLEHPEPGVRLGGNLDDSRCLRTGRSLLGLGVLLPELQAAWWRVLTEMRTGPEMEIPPH